MHLQWCDSDGAQPLDEAVYLRGIDHATRTVAAGGVESIDGNLAVRPQALPMQHTPPLGSITCAPAVRRSRRAAASATPSARKAPSNRPLLSILRGRLAMVDQAQITRMSMAITHERPPGRIRQPDEVEERRYSREDHACDASPRRTSQHENADCQQRQADQQV